MMKDIGYAEDTGISPVAVSQPFQLFSKDAVEQMRAEILSPHMPEAHAFRSNLAANQLRGYSPKNAEFTYDAWTHPQTLAIISQIARIPLVPEMSYEIGHINFSVKSEQQTQDERAEVESRKRLYEEDEGIAGFPWEDEKPVVGWHTDSYPFVCVLMLSDCKGMVGGETALRSASGDILKVRGPQMGCAVILQGRYITHQALRALGARERITSVTSFRPKSPFARDDTVLNTVRPISDLSELYYQFSEYRLEILEARIRKKLKDVREMDRAGKRFDSHAMKDFLVEQERFMNHTNHEIVAEDEVATGHIDEIDVPDVKMVAAVVPIDARTPKRTRVG